MKIALQLIHIQIHIGYGLLFVCAHWDYHAPPLLEQDSVNSVQD
jgi:hypothetical protein